MFNDPGNFEVSSKVPGEASHEVSSYSGTAGAAESPRADDGDVPLHGVAPPARFGRFALFTAAASALTLGVVGTVAYGIWFNHDQRAYAEAISSARIALGMPVTPVVVNGAAHGVVTSALLAKTVAGTAPASMRETTKEATRAPANLDEQALRAEQETDLQPEAPASKQAVWTGEVKVPAHSANLGSRAKGSSIAPINAPASGANNALTGEQPTNNASTDSTSQLALADNSATQSQIDPQPRLLIDPSASSAVTPSRVNRRAGASDAPQQSTAQKPPKDARLAQNRRSTTANERHKAGKDSLFARMSQFFRRVDYRQHGNQRQQDPYSHP